ncbi:Protein CBG21063 [Caenorhabditis briggsae]|uniref:Protein CBG21063 n=1 Tax=Caenorhabditis briggsae TaxID=6238 RepID=A8XZA0_CAEBR|nr:Protein CBG21063 [Caenorhabditis briggsae]CAP37967.2 Protein CBG21063 [Caenorhabditis briggsae]
MDNDPYLSPSQSIDNTDDESMDQNENIENPKFRNSDEILETLKMHFDQNPYPDDVQIDYIGILVGASSEFVSNWFENQRNEEEMCRQKENSISLKEEYEKRLNLHESFIDEKTSDAPPLFSPIAPPTTSSESNKLRRKLRESEQTCDSLLQTISEQSKQIEELKKGAESSKKSIIQEEEEQNLAMLAKDRKIRDLELKIGILEYSKEAGEREIQKLQNVLDSETSENAEKSKLDLKNAKIRALTHYIESDLKFQLKEKDQELAENYSTMLKMHERRVEEKTENLKISAQFQGFKSTIKKLESRILELQKEHAEFRESVDDPEYVNRLKRKVRRMDEDLDNFKEENRQLRRKLARKDRQILQLEDDLTELKNRYDEEIGWFDEDDELQ